MRVNDQQPLQIWPLSETHGSNMCLPRAIPLLYETPTNSSADPLCLCSELMISRCRPGLGTRHAVPLPSSVKHILRRRFNLRVRLYREWYLCYSGLITWLADGRLDLMSGLISRGCERSRAKHPKPRQRLPVAAGRITTTWWLRFRWACWK